MQIVLATNNKDKVKEIVAILAPIDVTIRTLDDFPGAPEVVEDGETLEHNALKKAREIREFTGLCALADDTGLEVDALDGAPGVYSSRYAGEKVSYDDNCNKLLEALDGVPDASRTARFRTVMALALVNKTAAAVYDKLQNHGMENVAVASRDEKPDALVTDGRLDGRITREKRGSSGFGYDPVFEIPKVGKTLAEIDLEEKNRISHRYRALVEMRELMLRLGLAASQENAAT